MSLEDDIRTTLLHERRALPAWPDAADRVHTGMRRRVRRRRLGTATAGLVALAIAVPVTLLHNGGPAQTSAAVVPWGGDVLVAPSPSAPVAPAPLPGPVPACSAADLDTRPVVLASPASVPGLSVVVVGERNVGATACRMAGRPTVYRAADGTWLEIAPSEVALVADPSTAGVELDPVIGPGESALVRIERSAACPPAPGTPGAFPMPYTDLALGVGKVRLQLPRVDLWGLCGGVAVSRWFAPRDGYHEELDGLRVGMDQVGPARAGHPLDFLVTLANPARQPVMLRPAPYYATIVGPVKLVYRLRPVPAMIPAGGVVTYEMRLDLPAGFQRGPTQLIWQLGTVGTDVGAAVQIDVTD